MKNKMPEKSKARFEYTTLQVQALSIVTEMNALADLGWRLVSACYLRDEWFQLFFEKPV